MAISYFDAALILVAWCETRAAFRHFRVDRIETAEERPERRPRRRRALIAEWKARDRPRTAVLLTMTGRSLLAAAENASYMSVS